MTEYTRDMGLYFRQEVHSRWQIAVAAIGIVSGAAISLSIINLSGMVWLLTGIGLVAFSIIRARAWAIVLALIGGLLIGTWRGGLETVALSAYDNLVGQNVELTGTVSEDADIDKRGATTVRLKDVSIGQTKISGVIWVSAGKKVDDIQRSDRVRLSGTLEEGFGTFAATMYRPDILSVMRPIPGDVALSVRNWFADSVRRVIAEPQASLGIGYLVGQRRALPPELDEALSIAGLTHVVVASGYNLTILVRLARRLFQNVSKYLSTLSASLMILGFIAVTGMSPSMSRAGLVAGLSLAAWYYGRNIHPLVLIPFAMAVTVLFNPSYVWGDVGWQLSFAAFAGVIIMAPLLQAYYFGDKKPGTLRQILGETFSAWLWTLPILAMSFGVVSNVAIFANLLVLPLVPLAMLLTFITGVCSLISPAVGSIAAWPTQILLDYMTSVATRFANLSWSQQEVDITPGVVLVCYGALAIWCWWMWRKERTVLAQSNIVE